MPLELPIESHPLEAYLVDDGAFRLGRVRALTRGVSSYVEGCYERESAGEWTRLRGALCWRHFFWSTVRGKACDAAPDRCAGLPLSTNYGYPVLKCELAVLFQLQGQTITEIKDWIRCPAGGCVSPKNLRTRPCGVCMCG